MKKLIAVTIVGLFVLAVPSRVVAIPEAGAADSSGTAPRNDSAGQPGDPTRQPVQVVQAVPPARPIALTAEQADALEAIAMQPQFHVDADTRAAFSPAVQTKITEGSAVGFYAGYFGTLAVILIAAAPL